MTTIVVTPDPRLSMEQVPGGAICPSPVHDPSAGRSLAPDATDSTTEG
jgi:hypothetical protein